MLVYEFNHMESRQASAMFKALGDPVRLRIVHLLAAAGGGKELCNCEFVDALEEPQPNISRHLRVLAAAGAVLERRDGRWVYYRLATESPAVATLKELVRSLKDSVLQGDVRRLRERLALRERGKCILGVQKQHLLSRSA